MFVRTNLNCALLENIDFTNSVLAFADLRVADLRGANLNDANLESANLKLANLKGIKTNNTRLVNIVRDDPVPGHTSEAVFLNEHREVLQKINVIRNNTSRGLPYYV